MKIISKIQRFQKMHMWVSNNNIIFFVLLFIQNIALFWQHYFNNVGFPWDFPMTYYAWPAFWTTSISMGIFPQWIPYEAMGYPLAMNSQSGLYYPVFWIFALLHIPFTLHAAVFVQVLHILFGSIGMFLLLKLLFKSSRYALIGAVAFQFFSGFYSEAENADIVRAFAIAPWLFYVFKLSMDEPKITRRILFIPVVIYFLATGGYPGILVSSIFIIAVFLSLQIANAYLKNAMKLRSLKVGGAIIGLAILGFSISIIHLGPLYQERNELTRFHDSPTPADKAENQKKLQYGSLTIGQFPLLFMSASPLPYSDQPWKSVFVSLPLLIFASFIPISVLKKYWIFVVVLILSLLMLPGMHSPVWQAITSAVPALKLSLFPSSDYRAFVAIPLIVLGVAGLKAIIEHRLSWKEFILRAAFVVTWFSLGVGSLYSKLGFSYMPWEKCYYGVQCHTQQLFLNSQIVIAVFILFAAILILLYYFRKNKVLSASSSKHLSQVSKIALLLIVLLISLDGFRYVYDMQTWKERPYDRLYVDFNMPLEKNGQLITYSVFDNIPSERPARETTPHVHDFSWKGYLQGNYMMNDYTSTHLMTTMIAESNNAYTKYMFLKWTPLFLEPNMTGSTRINLPVNTFSSMLRQLAQAEVCSKFICDSAYSNKNLIQPAPPSAATQNQAVQTHYGINDISYKVTLKEPKLMVENEIYFPGWHADLIFPDKEMKLQASVVNDVFRAWLLPAGDYNMVAHFQFPNLIIYQSISIISFAVWVFIMVKYWRRLDDYKQPMEREEFLRSS